MSTLDDLRSREMRPMHILGWGKPGTGKTVQYHSWPRPRTLDLDDGVDSVLWAVENDLYPEPEGWKYETIREEKLDRHGRVIKATAFDKATATIDEWLKEADEWDTLIVDSATSLCDYALNKAIEQMGGMGFSKSAEQSKAAGFQIRKMQDWGAAQNIIQQFFDWVRGIPNKHVILIAHEWERLDEDGATIDIQPALIGKQRQSLPKDFGEVWYADTKGAYDKTRFITLTRGTGRILARSRLGVFDAREDFLTYQRVQEKLKAAGRG